MISKAFPVKSSAPAIITKINHKENASQAKSLVNPYDRTEPVIVLTENIPPRAIYIPARIQETKVEEKTA
jgi:hypothetical protein